MKNVLKSVIAITFAIIIAGGSYGVDAEESLRIGILDLKPWGYKEQGRIVGMQVEIFTALSQETGIPFEYSLLPLMRAQVYLKDGDIDIVSLFARDELTEFVELVAKVRDETFYLVGNQGKTFTKETLQYIRTIGVIIGEETIVQKYLIDAYGLQAKIDVGGRVYRQLLLKLKAGRIDALCLATGGLEVYTDELGIPRDQFGELFIINVQKAYLQFSKQSPRYCQKVIKTLRKGFQQMREKGILHDIVTKYEKMENQ